MFLNTGARLAEMAGLQVGDIDFDMRELYVVGKGRKARVLPIGPRATKSLDRYMRMRYRRVLSEEPWLWIGLRGRLRDSGIVQVLRRRCRQAGIEQFHPHQFRHTWAHLWLSAGGTEHDLAQLAGWNSLEMVGRYAASAASERAREAHRRIGPGEDVGFVCFEYCDYFE